LRRNILTLPYKGGRTQLDARLIATVESARRRAAALSLRRPAAGGARPSETQFPDTAASFHVPGGGA